jgi:hypothetical protein
MVYTRAGPYSCTASSPEIEGPNSTIKSHLASISCQAFNTYMQFTGFHSIFIVGEGLQSMCNFYPGFHLFLSVGGNLSTHALAGSQYTILQDAQLSIPLHSAHACFIPALWAAFNPFYHWITTVFIRGVRRSSIKQSYHSVPEQGFPISFHSFHSFVHFVQKLHYLLQKEVKLQYMYTQGFIHFFCGQSFIHSFCGQSFSLVLLYSYLKFHSC